MKLLVGSVFMDDSPIQQQWLDLQLKFLKATTENFEHAVVLWKRQTDNFFRKTNVIEPKTHYTLSEAHTRGLNYLFYYFMERMEEFDSFLVLDSDAFPIKTGWLPELTRAMEPRPVLNQDGSILHEFGNLYEIAVAVRSENLEQRLHSSILFIKNGQSLPKLSAEYGQLGVDLKGDPEQDVFLPYYEKERHLAFPLVRSNQRNIHPLGCGVYYDMFYHHCCGSGRPFALRAVEYWKWTMGEVPTSHLTQLLMKSPERFVADLAGWSTDRYVKPGATDGNV